MDIRWIGSGGAEVGPACLGCETLLSRNGIACNLPGRFPPLRASEAGQEGGSSHVVRVSMGWSKPDVSADPRRNPDPGRRGLRRGARERALRGETLAAPPRGPDPDAQRLRGAEPREPAA